MILLIVKCLVVDDDPITRLLLKKCLAMRFGVSLSSNGVEGLLKAQQEKPDLIISDVEMPYLDGFEMVTEVRRILGDSVRIIMISANSENFKAGAINLVDGYLAKTIKCAELHSLIDSVL